MKNEKDISCIGLQIKLRKEGNNFLRLFGNYTNPANTRESYEVRFTKANGWEHLSVTGKKTPSWDLMCKMKDVFFKDDECCVEYHPAKKDYVNNDLHMLHIWKKTNSEFEMPPELMVGIKELNSSQTSLACQALVKDMSYEQVAAMLKDNYGETVNRKLRRMKK